METNFKDSEQYQRAQQQVQKMRGFYTHLTVYIVVNIFIIAGTFYDRPITIDNIFSWETLATPFFWGIGLVSHWSGVFGKNLIFGKDWEERKIQEYLNNQK